MTTGKKLLIAGAVVASVTGYMAYVGASASWQYYVTPDECLSNAAQFAGHRIRVNGTVVPGSMQIAPDRRHATFSLVGSQGNLQVSCTGSLPDDLARPGEVVVEGRLDESLVLRGDKVLTRCASKYESQGAEETGNHHPPNVPKEGA